MLKNTQGEGVSPSPVLFLFLFIFIFILPVLFPLFAAAAPAVRLKVFLFAAAARRWKCFQFSCAVQRSFKSFPFCAAGIGSFYDALRQLGKRKSPHLSLGGLPGSGRNRDRCQRSLL